MGEDPDKLDGKILQMVRLIKNGEEIKMSKRTGKTLTLNDLIEEVSVDAARYFFAMRSLVKTTESALYVDRRLKVEVERPISRQSTIMSSCTPRTLKL